MSRTENDFRLGGRALDLIIESLEAHADGLSEDGVRHEGSEDEAQFFEDAQRCSVLARKMRERIPSGAPIATVTFFPSNLPLHDKDLPLL